MKKHIVCYGDSNTHGYCADPADSSDGSDRFNEEERFPCILQKLLGDDYLVLEEGLSGRTTVFDDPLTEGLSGIDLITPVLMSHEPVDLLIVMLGTNDTKDRFGVNAECISCGMERLIKKAFSTECWKLQPQVLLICPPPIGEKMIESSVAGVMGNSCAQKSEELAYYYKQLADKLQISFLDAAGCEFNQVDHMHLTRRGHAQLARKIYNALNR